MKSLTAALIFQNGRMLCIHNTKHGTSRIEPPGGKQEPGESLDACIQRELQEEIGCDIQIISIFGDYATKSPEGDFTVRMYLAKIIQGIPKNKENSKHAKIEWCSDQDLQYYNELGQLVPNLAQTLPKLKKYFDHHD